MPVLAKKDTIRYRTSKFLRRRKKEIGTAALLLIAMTGFLVFHTIQITQERNLARQEAQRADEVSEFLLDLFETESGADTLSAAGFLQKGMNHLQEMDNQSAQAGMLSVMGQAYLNFGDFERAEKLLHKAVQESEKVYGRESPEYATALFKTGILHEHTYEWEEAVEYLEESYDLHLDLLGESHIKTANIASHLGISLRNTGRLDEAEFYSRRALDIHKDVLEPLDPQRVKSLANLAYVLRKQGETGQAESIYLEVIEKSEDNPGISESTLARYYNDLGFLYRMDERFDEAIDYYTRSLKLLKNNYVAGHPEVITTRRNLATSLYFSGRQNGAEDLFKENVSAIREKYSSNHWRTASTLNTVGLFYLKNGKFSEAEPYFRESTQINRNVLGEDHLWTAYSEGMLAASLKFQQKKLKEADSLYRHQFRLFGQGSKDFNSNNRNHVNRLIEMYSQHATSDTIANAYRELL